MLCVCGLMAGTDVCAVLALVSLGQMEVPGSTTLAVSSDHASVLSATTSQAAYSIPSGALIGTAAFVLTVTAVSPYAVTTSASATAGWVPSGAPAGVVVTLADITAQGQCPNMAGAVCTQVFRVTVAFASPLAFEVRGSTVCARLVSLAGGVGLLCLGEWVVGWCLRVMGDEW